MHTSRKSTTTFTVSCGMTSPFSLFSTHASSKKGVLLSLKLRFHLLRRPHRLSTGPGGSPKRPHRGAPAGLSRRRAAQRHRPLIYLLVWVGTSRGQRGRERAPQTGPVHPRGAPARTATGRAVSGACAGLQDQVRRPGRGGQHGEPPGRNPTRPLASTRELLPAAAPALVTVTRCPADVGRPHARGPVSTSVPGEPAPLRHLSPPLLSGARRSASPLRSRAGRLRPRPLT